MKRKLGHHLRGGDAIQRQLADSRSSEGRGALSGWVTCPLCADVSTKRFALGRGIAEHLQSVHAPWNPGKAELKKRRRLLQRKERENAHKRQRVGGGLTVTDAPTNTDDAQTTDADPPTTSSCERWDPSEQEIENWNAKVLEIVRSLEEQAAAVAGGGNEGETASSSTDAARTASVVRTSGSSDVVFVAPGRDRTGNSATTEYRDSLPTFLQASANGDLGCLKDMVSEARSAGEKELLALLNTKDRHLSTCEHWAAGSGHLSCLKYLVETRKSLAGSSVDRPEGAAAAAAAAASSTSRSKLRRRDGKTALHFAARNGHVDCIRYLLDEHPGGVDEASGDGTTPLHLACYGGQVEAFDVLVERGANVARKNDWGCSAAHWMGMTQSQSKENVRLLCRRILQHGVSFVEPQKQGHTALHKAAQRKNQHVIEWMASPDDEGGAGLSEEDRRLASRPDAGGHAPSDIWQSVRGDPAFGEWMRQQFEVTTD